MERPCDHLHVVAKQGGRAPENFADCFRILGQMGVISTHLRESLQSMARRRNLLIHLYWEVDDGTVSKEINVLKT